MIVVERCWTSGFVDRIYGRPQPHLVQLSFFRPRGFFDVRSLRSLLIKSVLVLMLVMLNLYQVIYRIYLCYVIYMECRQDIRGRNCQFTRCYLDPLHRSAPPNFFLFFNFVEFELVLWEKFGDSTSKESDMLVRYAIWKEK